MKRVIFFVVISAVIIFITGIWQSEKIALKKYENRKRGIRKK